MSTFRRFNRVQVDVLHRRTRVLASVTAGVLAAIMGSHASQAASANWNATATDGNWEATGAEANWSSGAATFPGTHPPASPALSTDVATFNVVSNFTNISINAATPNSDPLNIAGMTFTDTTVSGNSISPSNYIIGSTTGNALVMTANAAQGTSTDQIAISGSGRNTTPAPNSVITETINSPILLAAQSSGAGGNYSFQDNSNTLSNGDSLVFNGAISAGTMTTAASTAAGNSYGASLTLLGGSTNIANSVNGLISDGGAATFGGLAVFKTGTGTWTLSGNNTYTGLTTSSGGILRVTGNYSGGGGINIPGGGQIQILGSASATFGNANLATAGSSGGITVNTTGTATFGTMGLNGGNSFFTVTKGTAIVGQIIENISPAGSNLSASRIVNVNGGILQLTADVSGIVGTTGAFSAGPTAMNLNGGTIANWKNAPTGGQTLTIDALTNAAGPNFVHGINVQAGGGTFDTTLGNITSLAPLVGTTATSTVNVIGGNTLKAASATNSTYIMSVQGTSIWDYNGAAGQVGGLSGSGTVTDSGTAATLTENIASGTQTFSGNLGGSNAANVSFTKSGAGTQVFSGASSYTGATTINAGTLSVSGSLASPTIAVNSTGSMIVSGSVAGATTVNSGGFLAGTGNGSTTGALSSVVLAAGGTLEPGSAAADGSIGTLTMGSLDTTNGGTNATPSLVRFDLVTPSTSDLINVTGTATFSTAGNAFTLLGTPQAGTYTLVQAGTLAGTIPTLNFPTGTRSTFTPHFGDATSGANAFTLVVTGNAANLIWTGGNATSPTLWDLNTTQNWNDTTLSINPDVFFNLDSVTFDNSTSNNNVTLNSTVQPSSVAVNNDGTHTYTISGTGNITGSGTTLSKAGVGTLILATNNTYGGNTTISGGTVQIGSGGITGSLGTGVTTLSNNAALVFDHSDNPTLSTAVNGAGSLTQMGSGTLIITSSNNYSGSTIINPGGTIQLGNGTGTGNLGITSDVQDNGTLIFNRNNTSSITAPITGNGSLSIVAGTLSLGANNSYMGTTTIASGSTLQIGTGSNTGSLGAGALTNNGTLAFNRSDTVTAPTLGGTGALQQNGAGTLVLGAGNMYSGPTTVSNGVLAATNANAFGNTSSLTITNVAGAVSFRGDTSTAFVQQSDNVTPYNVSLSSTGGTVDVNQATVAGTAAKTMTIGNIDASASTSGTFALTLTGGNNTGLTAGNIVGPTLTTGTANVTINNNNTSGTTTIATYSQSATTSAADAVTFQGGGNTVMTGGYNPSIDGSISVQAGSLTILGSSSYSQGTTIGANPNNNNVTVAIGNDNSLGFAGAINFNDDPGTGTFMSADSNTRTILNPITNSSTNFTFGSATTGNLVFGSPGTTILWSKGQFPKNLIVNCPVMTINDVIANAPGNNGAFSMSGTGTLVLAGVNTYDCNTVVNQGTMVLATTGSIATSGNATPGTGGVTVGNGAAATLVIAGNTSATAGFLAQTLNNLTITSTGTVNLQDAAASSGPTVNSNRTVLVAAALSVTSGGMLNLGSNDMIVHNGTLGTVSTAGTITNLIATGRGANGLWTSTGINSSDAAAAPGKFAVGVELNDDGTPAHNTLFSTFDGQPVVNTDVLMKYTYAGDADLSGTVTATDYMLIDNGFNSGGTLTGWRNGDFNYDGVINGDDYTLIDNAFNTQGTTSFAGISAGPAEMIASNTDQIAGASSSAVPEPTTLSVVGIGAASLLMRRRRRVSVTIV